VGLGMRGNQVSRQWKILKVLESHKRGMSAAPISARLGVPLCIGLAGFGFKEIQRDAEGKG